MKKEALQQKMAWELMGKSLLFNVGETSDLEGLLQPS